MVSWNHQVSVLIIKLNTQRENSGTVNLNLQTLTLKAPISTAADDIHNYIFHCFFFKKIMLDFSSESSAR